MTGLIDYEQFCGIRGEEQEARELGSEWEIEPQELHERMERGEEILILDVRNPEETQISRIEGSRLIPLPELPERAAELDTAEQLVVDCRSGVRRAEAAELLRALGFGKVKNLVGGINAWAGAVDLSLPRYCSASAPAFRCLPLRPFPPRRGVFQPVALVQQAGHRHGAQGQTRFANGPGISSSAWRRWPAAA